MMAVSSHQYVNAEILLDSNLSPTAMVASTIRAEVTTTKVCVASSHMFFMPESEHIFCVVDIWCSFGYGECVAAEANATDVGFIMEGIECIPDMSLISIARNAML